MTSTLRDIAIIGGGCYGTFYAGQLAQARDKGRIVFRRVLIVDHDPGCQATRDLPPRADRLVVVEDWGGFLDRFLVVDAVVAAPPPPGPTDPTDPTDLTDPDDAIVPSPLMPHLMASWLERRARARWPGRLVEQRPHGAEIGTPYESTGPDGTRYLSFADWICPVHCVEPLTCPVIRAPRTWELSDTLAAFSRDQGLADPATFHCHHEAFGVGMFHAREARAGWRRVEQAGLGGEPADVVIGTVSRCHGAVAVLHLGDNREGTPGA